MKSFLILLLLFSFLTFAQLSENNIWIKGMLPEGKNTFKLVSSVYEGYYQLESDSAYEIGLPENYTAESCNAALDPVELISVAEYAWYPFGTLPARVKSDELELKQFESGKFYIKVRHYGYELKKMECYRIREGKVNRMEWADNDTHHFNPIDRFSYLRAKPGDEYVITNCEAYSEDTKATVHVYLGLYVKIRAY